MWTNAIKHAAWLVQCDDDTPPDVVKVRREAANTIKRQWDEIESLQAELTDAKQLEAELRDVRNTLKENLIISLATQRKVKTVHPTCNDGYRRGLTEAIMELELAFGIGTPATVDTVRERKRGVK